MGEELDKFNATVSPTWSNGACAVNGRTSVFETKLEGGRGGCEESVMDDGLMQAGLT